jgi:hypothetical protein
LDTAVVGRLDAAEDGCDLTLELGEVQIDDGAARMQDDVDWRAEQGECRPDSLAQASLDAIAINRLTESFRYRQANAGARRG